MCPSKDAPQIRPRLRLPSRSRIPVCARMRAIVSARAASSSIPDDDSPSASPAAAESRAWTTGLACRWTLSTLILLGSESLRDSATIRRPRRVLCAGASAYGGLGTASLRRPSRPSHLSVVRVAPLTGPGPLRPCHQALAGRPSPKRPFRPGNQGRRGLQGVCPLFLEVTVSRPGLRRALLWWAGLPMGAAWPSRRSVAGWNTVRARLTRTDHLTVRACSDCEVAPSFSDAGGLTPRVWMFTPESLRGV
jgi:hypothetical protein